MKLITTGRMTALCLALGLPLAAQAQTMPAPPAPAAQVPPAAQTPAGAVGQGRRMQNLSPEQMMQRVEAHLSRLHSQLGITQAQEPQWQEFARATRDNATGMRERFSQRGAQLAQMSAADSMLSFARISEQNAQERLRVATAFKALYDAMSPEQKQRTDAVFRAQHEQRQQQRQQHRQMRGAAARTGSGG